MSWKTVLYDYVHNRSQMELDYAVAPVLSLVRDEAFADRLNRRVSRTMLLHMERNLKPLRHETRLKLLSLEETEGNLYVDIAMNRMMIYECRGRRSREDRSERERIKLSFRNGRWIIAEVISLQTEDDRSGKWLQADKELADNGERPWDSGAGPGDFARTRTGDSYSDVFGAEPDDLTVVKSTPFINKRQVYAHLEAQERRMTYDREKVRQYADTWWNGANPQYEHFEVDCSSFVSQCIFAGGAPMNYTGKRGLGWWYRGKFGYQELWSYSWAVANSLARYLGSKSRVGLSAEAVDSPRELELGDVVSYSWEGGPYQHSTIVTAFDGEGMPLVNAHTVDSRHRYWDYRDSYAWTEQTKYSFYHIADRM
ncbi:amidase domain-containing protein [Paenibacillus sp. MBLB4367]|uniref:amidase domain-containing protein n=1 Tax=Paenibacillus sp. MBLB4367 TaxID=3384767 RepID=UPI0039082229